MTEILSQKEIDDLLTALSEGHISADEIKQEGEEKHIKVYDFRRPNKFSKEQLRTLHMIHENWIYVNKVDTFSRINFMQLS